MLLNSNIKNKPLVLQLDTSTEKKRKPLLSSFWKWFLNIVRTAIAIGISLVSDVINTVAPGLGIWTDFLFNTVNDLIFNSIVNEGQIDWVDFGIAAGLNAIPFTLKGLRRISNFRKGNKLYGLAQALEKEQPSLAKQIRSQADLVSKFGTKLAEDAPYYKDVETHALKFFEQLNNAKSSIKYAEAKIAYDAAFKRTNHTLNKLSKTIHKIKVGATMILSPRYAARKAAQFALRKPVKFVEQKWNKWIDSKVSKVVKATVKGTNKTVEEAQKNILLNSAWLQTLKIYKAYNPWNMTAINAVVTFNPKTTNNKKPVLLVQKDYSQVMKLVSASSPGNHYLNTFAWGWEIGKILRNSEKILLKSKLPLYVRFISNFNYIFKSIQYIAKSSINRAKRGWSGLGNEIYQGLKEGALKWPKLKYIDPLFQAFRSSITNNAYYAFKKGLNIGHKSAWNIKIKKTLDGHYVNAKSLRKNRTKGVK